MQRFAVLRWVSVFLLTCAAMSGAQAEIPTPSLGSGGATLSAGNDYTLAVNNQGKLLGWGRPISTGSAKPITVPIAKPVRKVFAGPTHAFAVDADGALWAWGNNAIGQLGDGTTGSRAAPVRVGSGFVNISSNLSHTLGVKQDGSLWAWGSSGDGRLGDGSGDDQFSPAYIGDDIGAVAAGALHSMALTTTGRLWVWGSNRSGQLGMVMGNASSPTLLASGVTAIAAGESHSLALNSDGSLYAWGDNSAGQLGNGTYTNATEPVLVGSGYTQIAAHAFTSLALKGDGSLWVWGEMPTGDGATVNYFYTPRQIGSGGFTSIAAGTDFGLAVNSQGQLVAWGDNLYGQLGDGSTSVRMTPVVVGTGYVGVSAGDGFAVGLKSDGTVWAWGDDYDEQLGNGPPESSTTVSEIGTGFKSVAVGLAHKLALKTDGSLWSWGFGERLGLGNVAHQSTPQQVGNGYTAIAAGSAHSLALKTDGSLWGWGNNAFGQLGPDGGSQRPKQIGTAQYVAIAAGYRHSLALQADGALWTWGRNDFGQLGDASTTDRAMPLKVGDGFVAMAAGSRHTVALKQDSSLWAWGNNRSGQLGSTLEDQTRPILVGKGFTKVQTGQNHTLAMKSDGSVWVWGDNFFNEKGDGTGETNQSLFRVGDGFVDIGSGPTAASSMALRRDGTVLSWGYNAYGQLGNGTFAQNTVPGLVVDASLQGFLSMSSGTVSSATDALKLPFFVASTGGVANGTATVKTRTEVLAVDLGKPGAIYVTARVPSGSALVAASGPSPQVARAIHPRVAAASANTSSVLMQLTPSGWQPVVNGQLIPYTSGVLGDKLAAQTILNATDTTNLKGAEFCVGYGSSAAEMNAAGRMRTVATIPDPNVSSAALSCLPVVISKGWNLLGNGLNQSIAVQSLYTDTSWVNAVWKWDSSKSQWQFYSPAMDAASLQSFAQGKGYAVLSTLQPGDGYWVQATAPASILPPAGGIFTLTGSQLAKGWNLSATGVNASPAAFNASLSASPTPAGTIPSNFNSLWAWDAASQSWYFYAPSLEAQGSTAMTDYISSHGLKDFTGAARTLGANTGFWVNRP